MAESEIVCPEQLSLIVRNTVEDELATIEIEFVLAPVLHKYVYGGMPPDNVGVILTTLPGQRTVVSERDKTNGITS